MTLILMPLMTQFMAIKKESFFTGIMIAIVFLPLYVFCKDQLLVSYLRRSNIDGAKHAWAILALLVRRFRKQWPDVEIVFRGDGGFCRHKMFNWCESNNVKYIVGIAKNNILEGMVKEEKQLMGHQCEKTRQAQRCFKDLRYAAGSWKKQRRVIAKVEHLPKGSNPRFIVTNLQDDARELYEQVYCARGDMENRIKEQQLGLFADRTSCGGWWANQFRLMLSSAAYILLETIRRTALKGTDFAKSQVTTIGLKLLKIGAVIITNTRRIRFLFSSSYPWQEQFMLIANRLNST
ncbi:MAG: IS1380 family transposase [Proteobacteria bacterium]|nr:IS1380 family transposase [Pseudomonadota bacterium]